MLHSIHSVNCESSSYHSNLYNIKSCLNRRLTYLCLIVITSMKHFLFIFIIALNSCNQSSKPQHLADSLESSTTLSDSATQVLKKQNEELAQKIKLADITYIINPVAGNKFGYSIYIDGLMYIEQEVIPAIEGNRGFDTREEAEKIAKLAIEKIRQGELPPVISIEELKAKGVHIHS